MLAVLEVVLAVQLIVGLIAHIFVLLLVKPGAEPDVLLVVG